MKRAAGPWKVVLIVEDDSDGRTLCELIARTHPGVQVAWLPGNGIGNIKRDIERLIDLARGRIRSGNGCVAVIVDRDGKDPRKDEPHATILRVCENKKVPLVACRETIEAWFLADPGCCEWLGIPLGSTTHGIKDPKKQIGQAFYKKTRRPYQQRRARFQIAQQATGPEGHRNDSLGTALGRLSLCPDRG